MYSRKASLATMAGFVVHSVFLPSLVHSSSASFDPDGDALTFLWEQLEGPTVLMTNAAEPQTTYLAPEEIGSIVTFRLTVSDGRGGSDTAIVTYTVVAEAISPTKVSRGCAAIGDQPGTGHHAWAVLLLAALGLLLLVRRRVV